MTEDQPSDKTTIREYYEALLIAVVFVNFARIFVFQAFKIPSGSMHDNLLVGDHIIVNKFVYGPPGNALFARLFAFREIQRGEIVVFRYPKDRRIDFVKRVIALPGDEVMIRDKSVYINGVPLREEYVLFTDPVVYEAGANLPPPYRSRDQFGPFRVPPENYFVMGDNRDQSNDSRFWGTVPRSLMKGRPFLIYWSFRSSPPLPESPPGERIRELLRVVARFFPSTRWDRTFMVVDSKYHYESESQMGGTE